MKPLDRPTLMCIGVGVIGAALLFVTFHVDRGGWVFWVAGLAMAAVWIGGAKLVFDQLGDIPVPETNPPAVLASGAFSGLATSIVFYVGSQVLDGVPLLGSSIKRVISTTDAHNLALLVLLTIVGAVAEEVFFRDTLFEVVARLAPPGADRWWTVRWTTAAYAVVTIGSLNVALVITAVAMGALFGVLREMNHTVNAPMLSHVTFSVLMVLALHH